MKRIFVVTEGQSETNFVKSVLAPYFVDRCIFIPNTVVTKNDYRNGIVYKGGISNYQQIRNTLTKSLMSASKSPDSFVTTMFDYYGLPRDVPGMNGIGDIEDPYQRISVIESAIADAESSNTHFFFPYIQLHEFESMIFSDLSVLQDMYFEYDIAYLEKSLEQQENPELINNGIETAPSKRIYKCIPHYDKANVGVDILAQIGIENIATKCKHFSGWLEQIEKRI